MADRWACVAVLAAAFASGAWAEEIGDFGRVEVYDRDLVPPFSRDWRAPSGYKVTGFNVTDEEREMYDRVWRFLFAPHGKDWAWQDGDRLQVVGFVSYAPAYNLFYEWLAGVPYQSSHVRYNTMADAIGADLLTLPATFNAICVVLRIDEQRAIAAVEVAGVEPRLLAERVQRQADNDAYIAQFAGALSFRYNSYSYALDQFLVETPHLEAIRVDSRLSELAVWLDRAVAGDYCLESWADELSPNGAIPGRVLIDAEDEGEYRK